MTDEFNKSDDNGPSGESNSKNDTDSSSDKKEIPAKLFRSKSNRIIFGVCGGLGGYFNIDPLLFRIGFVVSLIFGVWGALFYLIISIIIPENPAEEFVESTETKKENTKVLLGSSLILLGLYLLLKNIPLFRLINFWGFTQDLFVPLILITIGIILIFKFESITKVAQKNNRLYRSINNRKIAGVCGGLGEYLNIDPTVVRILWLIFTFSSFGIGVLIYLLFIIIVPEEKKDNTEIEK